MAILIIITPSLQLPAFSLNSKLLADNADQGRVPVKKRAQVTGIKIKAGAHTATRPVVKMATIETWCELCRHLSLC